MNKATVYLALICSACAPACVSSETDEEAPFGEASQDMISLNGVSLNGTTLSGSSVLAGSSTAPPLTGGTVVGSTWIGTASNSALVKLRIDSAQAGTAPNADTWFYAVSYQTSAGWSPLCGLDAAKAPIRAVPVAGVWSSAGSDSASYGASALRFTFACRGKSVAKCVELGYKPYKGYANQLAACVRMLRGDYCGSGNAHTVDGTTINLYDNVGLQGDTAALKPEAEWTPNGARCVNSQNAARWQLEQSKEPSCVKPMLTTTCGASFANGAVLINEFQN